MANTLLRDQARVLRARGASLNDITRRLKIPKSTIRYWCRDVVLTSAQQRKLFRRQALGGIRAAEKMRRRRLNLIKQLTEEGKREIGDVSKRELLLIGIALYWAEGYRKGDGEFGFTNSDPKMIQLMTHWLHSACGIEKYRIHLRVCINVSHQKRIRAIQKFWSKTTGIPSSQFSKPTFIHARGKKTYLNPKIYFGTLRVKVRRSVNLRRKILGWIKGVVKAGCSY